MRHFVMVFFASGFLGLPASAHATSGGLDGAGCHHGGGVYHCHPARAKSVRLPGGETQPQRDKRLRRECKGRPNAGACLGFAS